MKNKLFLILIFIISCRLSFSQGTAPDWTHTDCYSVSHNLYSYLDSQEVVVMEFSMACISCNQAASFLMNIKDEYAISHPGKVNFFLMDYYDTNDCSEVISMMGPYNFDAGFANCLAEKEAYWPSIFPMPGVIIAAGNYHTVIYQKLGWVNTDTTLIKQRIDQFFNTVNVEEATNDVISLYPNPVDQKLYIEIDTKKCEVTASSISVFDMAGRKIPMTLISPNISGNGLSLSTGELSTGSYIIEIWTPITKIREIFIKN